MREHIRLLGILNVVMGCLTAAIGLIALLVMGSAAHIVSSLAGMNYQEAVAAGPVIAAIGLAIGVFFLLLAAPSIIGGLGLLNFRPWSRIVMIVLSIFHLLHVPLGTALGVYGLWVLFSDEARRLLESGGQVGQVPPGYYAQATYPPRPPSAG